MPNIPTNSNVLLGIDKNTRPEAIMPTQYLMMYGLINKKETDYNKR